MSNKIFKITKNLVRAKSIFELAKDRFNLIKIYPREKVYKIVEEYYEVIKEMMISFSYAEGYKILGHIELINYFFNNCKIFNENQKKIIDALRRLRQGSLYYGEKATYDFLINNESEIKNIIKILEKFVGSKIWLWSYFLVIPD